MKFTTLLPMAYNDGTPVPPSKIEKIVRALWRPFEGMTNEGPVEGYWRAPDGTVFQDSCVKISVSCERSQLAIALKAVKRAGRKLRQRAMYFEVSGYDGIQIISLET